ncbi:MAG: hypothetical protein FWD94_03400 [Treponema sp.]|nr:hypothetical protein [Treponema sp.]
MTKRRFPILPAVTTAALVLVLAGCPTGDDGKNNGGGGGGGGGSSLISGEIGATLAFTDVQVYTLDESGAIPAYPVYTGTTTFTTKTPSDGTATLTDGKLTLNFGTPVAGDLTTTAFSTFLSDYNSVAVAPVDAKAVFLELSTATADLRKMNSELTIGGTSFTLKTEHVDYVYVNKDVTVTGNGKTNVADGSTLVTKNFTLALKEGWNAIYRVDQGTGEEDIVLDETMSVNDSTGLKWVLD